MSPARVAGLLVLGGGGLWSCGPANSPPQASAPASARNVPADWPATFGLGRRATAEQIAGWDIDVGPDGTGLPPGRGTVAEGEAVYRSQCAACHGPTGIEGPNDRLVGRLPGDSFPFGRTTAYRREQTIGSYWPYATTLYDYINRAMPQNAPGSLLPDQIYAVTAYLLYLNQLVPREAVMDPTTLPAVVMPARDRFVADDRTGGPVVR